ncbi:hypothetical protein [uncultured Roseibium sp.]|uniref:phage tail assembly chaperone n=1 Tax=uncultured Roseibium sp. TaxID=1936171 RepID=UPI00260AEAE1|nr:hypothetical protein [uncultured Roseibium sp.]
MAQKTGKVPPALKRKPELFEDLRLVWEAFKTLSPARQYYNGAPQPIPLSEILAYCQMFEINDLEERREFAEFIIEMDTVFIAAVLKKSR